MSHLDQLSPLSTQVASQPVPRVRVGALTQRLVLALILPVTLALILDWLAGTQPLFTLAAALFCIPLATVLVSKSALRDMDRVIAHVAPPEVADAGTEADSTSDR